MYDLYSRQDHLLQGKALAHDNHRLLLYHLCNTIITLSILFHITRLLDGIVFMAEVGKEISLYTPVWRSQTFS